MDSIHVCGLNALFICYKVPFLILCARTTTETCETFEGKEWHFLVGRKAVLLCSLGYLAFYLLKIFIISDFEAVSPSITLKEFYSTIQNAHDIITHIYLWIFALREEQIGRAHV